MSKAMDDKNKIGEELFGIADDLMLAQRDLINNQNDLIRRLMDRVDHIISLSIFTFTKFIPKHQSFECWNN